MMRAVKSTIIIVLVLSLYLLVSCRPPVEFGELFICSSVEEDSFAPLEIVEQFDVEAEKIYAAIKVSGVRSEDTWRFTWKNRDTGYILADSTNVYSKDTTGYVEGYLAYELVPDGKISIIGEPGDYVVEFYHNGELKASGVFIIKKPVAQVTSIILSGGIDGEGKPLDEKAGFFQDEIIYAFVELDYRIPGDRIDINWFRKEGELLGQSSLTVDKAFYFPGYTVFQISNEGPWPIGDYSIEVIHNGHLAATDTFEIIPYQYLEEVIKEPLVYENTVYDFKMNYPRSWSFEESEEESGLKVNFYPDITEKNFIINMWVYREGYYPEGDDFSGFSDDLLKGVIESEQKMDMHKDERQGEIGDVPFAEIEYQYLDPDGKESWNTAFSFIRYNKMLYIISRISDIDYLEYSREAYEDMRNSIEFME